MYFKIDINNVIIVSASYLNNPEGFIKITGEDLEGVRVGLDRIIDGKIVKATQQEVEVHAQKLEEIFAKSQAQSEIEQNRGRRITYLNAYRRYQAAVNYGEFERCHAIDEFIARLRHKDWRALDSIPNQIRYFMGETTLVESGLILKNMQAQNYNNPFGGNPL